VRVEIQTNPRLSRTRILATRRCERKGPFYSDREILGAWHIDENPVSFRPWKPGATPEQTECLTMHPEVYEEMKKNIGETNITRVFS